MSCWVAPTIAADMWGLPLHDVLALIASGHFHVHSDGGFRFMQLPPFSVVGMPLAPIDRPCTFTTIQQVVSPAEHAALHEELPDAAVEIVDEDPELGPPPDEDPTDDRILNWRTGRQRASTTRRPPPRSDDA